MFSKKIAILLVVAVLLGLVAACTAAAPQPEVVTVVETVIVEKEVEGETVTVVETVEVVKEVEVEKVVEVAAEDPDAGRIKVDTVISTEPPSLDPALATDNVSIFFIRQLFTGLAGFDEEANVIPALASDWSVS